MMSEVKARVMSRATATRYYNGEGTVKEILEGYYGITDKDDLVLVISYIVAFYPDIPVYDPYE